MSPRWRQVFPAGARIFREGEVGDRAYVLEGGKVEITALRGGRKVRLAVLAVDDLLGEMAILDDQVRSATATALEDTAVVIVQRDRVKAEIARASPLLQLFLRVLLERLRLANLLLLQGEGGADGPAPPQPAAGDAFAPTRRQAIDHLKREQQLRLALDTDALELHYQPIHRLADGSLVALEALVRWRQEDGTLTPPAEFIALAEESGLIVPLEQQVLERACRDLARLGGDGEGLVFHVNLSARQLTRPELLDELSQVLAATGADPSRLCLEITETALVEDPDRAALALERLRRLGPRFVLDDFGTGYSSLSYLRRFPIDGLKIDHAFVTTMLQQRVSRQIVEAITGLAAALELDLVAEGIESEEQLERLRHLGCPLGQGHWFSPAMPLADLDLGGHH